MYFAKKSSHKEIVSNHFKYIIKSENNENVFKELSYIHGIFKYIKMNQKLYGFS